MKPKLRKILIAVIFGFIFFGWFSVFERHQEGKGKLNSIALLAVDDIQSIKVIDENYVKLKVPALNSLEVRDGLLKGLAAAKAASLQKAPQGRKIFVEIATKKGVYGIDMLVPHTSSSIVYFRLVDRTYSGKSFRQSEFGQFASRKLSDFVEQSGIVPGS